MKPNLTPRQTAVALIQEDVRGLRATGAFTRFDAPFAGSARPGDLVQVSLGEAATPVKRLGRPSSVSSVIAALALHSGELSFTDAQEAAALKAAEAAPELPRKDLCGLPTFTIDW